MTPDVNRLAHFILRDVRRAIRAYEMLAAGDRVAVAVSGGKDSLALLDLLARLRSEWPASFELAAVHVRGDGMGVTPPHPPLEAWLATRGLPYRIVTPDGDPGDGTLLSCQRCSWLRRKALFLAAEELGCNVVAYAHHADDVARTTLMNVLYGGMLRSLAPAADYFGGRFRLIRPLVFVPESELRRYARAGNLPEPPPACPRSADSRRGLVAAMLKQMGRDYLRQARPNLVRAGLAGAQEPETDDSA